MLWIDSSCYNKLRKPLLIEDSIIIIMCSIIAYKGKSAAAEIIINALKRMEYRGYDSVGIATLAEDKILLKKGVGKVDAFCKSISIEELKGSIGIGHTRWATHGGITDYNAHPHKACSREVAIAHNGKIDNYKELKQELIAKGHRFDSETDSEVIAHLIEEYLKYYPLKHAIINTCNRLRGSYAFTAIIDDGTIVGARKDEPLIIGIDKDNYYIASDVLAFIEYTDQVIFLDNNEIAIIDDTLNIYSLDGRSVKKSKTQIAWEFADIDKGKFAHYTLKEIHEQEHTIANVFAKDYDLEAFKDAIINADRLLLIASGSSYNASLLAKHILTRLGISCEAIIASECQYYKDLLKGSVLLAISQSGETKDVLRAVKLAKEYNSKVLSIVNVRTSSLARESDLSLSIDCGPEIGVAATKSFTAQIALLYRIANAIDDRFDINFKSDISKAVRDAIGIDVDHIVDSIKDAKDIYILARGLHYPIALEGALKIKELAYIHAEGMYAGEFRHGPLALIDENSIVIILNPKDDTYDDTYSNIHEIKARKGKVIGISDLASDMYDYSIKIPSVDKLLYPLIEVIPLQLLAYNLALKKEYNPDYPRNLAKSVTVD